MTLLLIYLFIALTVSFLCSIAEAVLLSTPISYLKANKKSENRGLKKISDYKHNIDKPLSAILSLNTVAHTVGAAGVGAQAAIVFGDIYFALVSGILTILILVLTEIIPKTIGANYWRKLAGVSGNIISAMIVITYPLVLLSAVVTKLISKNTSEKSTSREEISALAEIGMTEGIFQDKENKIIQNLIKLKNTRVIEIMTPRTVVKLVDEEMTLEELDELHEKW
jgi:CBS domain containing-hemolysin-like protein